MQIAVRLGVVVCVLGACFLAAGRLDDAVAVFDFQADANVAATFPERSYPEVEWLPGGAKVMEDGRLWMPEDATYRFVEGPRFGLARWSSSLSYFLLILMLPRTQTELESAPWVFCGGCTRPMLGPEYEVLSDSGRGFLFARRRS